MSKNLLSELFIPVELNFSYVPASVISKCRIGSPIRPRHTVDCAGAN
ncbi:hypothetical protein CCUS01_11817 [Colletotrichum cuscutae]|uniref:Uncharacterized protein n=1 Tax=Colletotrichum cuscutae TaxID=1209917 RepID=A0AAI9U0S8_9PEZI|nr:hypothetical protein CCUS01_11817 [Colletotrichum cuscutae]